MQNSDSNASVGNIRARFENGDKSPKTTQGKRPTSGVGNLKNRFGKSDETSSSGPKATFSPKPATFPTKPVTSLKPGTLPTKPGAPATNSRAVSPKPKIVPSKPETDLSKRGVLPSKPGQLSSKPGTLPTKPGQLPSKPGTFPTKPGNVSTRPTKPGNVPSKPGTTSSPSSVSQKAANFSQGTKPSAQAKPSPGSKPWNQTTSSEEGKSDKKPYNTSSKGDEDSKSDSGPTRTKSGRNVGQMWENKIQNEDNSPKVKTIENKIDIKSLSSKIANQLGATVTQMPSQEVLTKETDSANQHAVSSRNTMPEYPPPPPPMEEDDAWDSWVDGELPPPLEDDISAPTPIPPNSSKPVKPLPAIPGRPSSIKNKSGDVSIEEPVWFKNQELPTTVQGACGEMKLQPFKKASPYPPSTPDRPAEMAIKKGEVLGPEFQGAQEADVAIDEIYDDVESDSPSHRPMTMIMPMTEEEEDELDQVPSGLGRLGRPPSDIYDETLDPNDLEAEDIYEDV